MVAIRKAAVLLTLLIVVTLSAGVAQAQPQLGLISCTATAVPPVVRAEGIAELAGDILLNCAATPGSTDFPIDNPANPVLHVNVGVQLNVNVTNNISGSVTDAVLIINENHCVTPQQLGSQYGNDSCAAGQFQDAQLGTKPGNQNTRLEWNDVSFPVPGAIPVGDEGNPFPVITTLRITSLRANASQLGILAGNNQFPSAQITALVTITGPTSIALNNNILNIAVPIRGLIVTGGSSVSGLQCVEESDDYEITLKEGFATSFKTIGVPTFEPGQTQWESGYYAFDTDLGPSNKGGGASQGTQFRLHFEGVPDGVELTVPNFVCGTGADGVHPGGFPGQGLELVRLSGGSLVSHSGAGCPGSSGSYDVPLSGGVADIYYEVVDTNSFVTESVTIPVSVSWTPDTANDKPAVGTGLIGASFWPQSSVNTANASAPEPRFIETTGELDEFVSVARCTTTLLFPFVSNQAGFDTGIAISNTSEDWIGTEPQRGNCTIHYIGEKEGGAPPNPMDETTDTPLEGGEQLLFVLSNGGDRGIVGNAGFQGFLIVECDFQFAHGYAFITDGFGGIPALAQGYLALVIPVTDDGTNGSGRWPGIPNVHLLGESLSH
jgi:hypothetical protein